MGRLILQRLVLEGTLGMQNAADLAGLLATALEASAGAAIDLSAVHSVDSAVLQVLIAGHRSAAESRAPFGFLDPNAPALRDALVAHGMIAADGSPLTPEHDFWTRAVALLEDEAV